MPESADEFTGRELGAVLGCSARDAGEHAGPGLVPGGEPARHLGGVPGRGPEPGQGRGHRRRHRPPGSRRGPRGRGDGAGPGRVPDPGALRAAISRAVMEVNPDKAKKRREHMAKRTRVERWAEDSGNAGWPGGNCPRPRCWPLTSGSPPGPGNCGRRAWTGTWTSCAPAPSWTSCSASTPGPWPAARTARPARTRRGQAGNGGTGPDEDGGSGPDGSGPGGRGPAPAGPLSGVIPPGFAGRVTLTIPAVDPPRPRRPAR